MKLATGAGAGTGESRNDDGEGLASGRFKSMKETGAGLDTVREIPCPGMKLCVSIGRYVVGISERGEMGEKKFRPDGVTRAPLLVSSPPLPEGFGNWVLTEAISDF